MEGDDEDLQLEEIGEVRHNPKWADGGGVVELTEGGEVAAVAAQNTVRGGGGSGGRHWPVADERGRAARARCSAEQGRVGLLTHGPGGTVTGTAVTFQNFKRFENVQIFPNFDRSKFDLPELQKFEIKYSFEDLEKWTTFSIETSSYSEWISS
jgi:hypothetical protein